MDEKVKCVCVNLGDDVNSQGGYILTMGEGEELMMEFAESEVGEVYTVRVIEMTRAELHALPEFDGF